MRPVIDHQDVAGAAEQQVQDRRQTTVASGSPLRAPAAAGRCRRTATVDWQRTPRCDPRRWAACPASFRPVAPLLFAWCACYRYNATCVPTAIYALTYNRFTSKPPRCSVAALSTKPRVSKAAARFGKARGCSPQTSPKKLYSTRTTARRHARDRAPRPDTSCGPFHPWQCFSRR